MFQHWKWPADGTGTVPIVSAHFSFRVCAVNKRSACSGRWRRDAVGGNWQPTIWIMQGLNWGRGITPDLRSGTSCLRSTTSNNRSCTSQLRSGTFLLGSTTLLGRTQAPNTTLMPQKQTECLECSTTPGRRSGTPPLLSALQASRLSTTSRRVI